MHVLAPPRIRRRPSRSSIPFEDRFEYNPETDLFAPRVFNRSLRVNQLDGFSAGGEFDPRQVPTLDLFLDFSDANSVDLSGSDITQIDDKSGNARHASQASATQKLEYITTGGPNNLNFGQSDGVDEFLSGDSWTWSAHTLFLVFKDNSLTSGSFEGIFGHSDSTDNDWNTVNGFAMENHSDNNEVQLSRNGSGGLQMSKAAYPTTFSILEFYYGSGAGELLLNGSSVATDTHPDTDTIASEKYFISASRKDGNPTPQAFSQIDWGLILQYGTKFGTSSAEANAIRSWIKGKWGTP